MTDFTIILRSMSSRMFSTVVTVVTVAVAVGLMLVLLSMRDSGRRAFERGSGNMHLLISADSDPLTGVLNGVFYARPPRRPIEWAKYQEIASDPRITGDERNTRLTPGYAIPIQLGDSFRGLPVLATTPEFFTRFRPDQERGWEWAAGAAFTQDFEVVLGSEAARDTGLKMGEKIVLTHGAPGAGTPPGEAAGGGGGAGGAAPHEHTEFKYTVVGILAPTGTAHDRALFTSLQSTWIIHAHDRREREAGASGDAHDHDHDHEGEEGHDHDHDHDHAHETPTTAADLIDADRKITGIYLRVVTIGDQETSAVLPQVFDGLRRDSSITVAAPVQEISKLFGIVANVDRILLAMAAVVMVSSGIGIMLALYNSMEQRRRQIAVLRVLGCSRGRVFGLVMTESALLGVLGGVAGFVLCLAGVRLVTAVMKQRLGLVIEPVFDPGWVLGVVVGTVLLAAVAGVVPAVMAYRTSVAKNLRPMG